MVCLWIFRNCTLAPYCVSLIPSGSIQLFCSAILLSKLSFSVWLHHTVTKKRQDYACLIQEDHYQITVNTRLNHCFKVLDTVTVSFLFLYFTGILFYEKQRSLDTFPLDFKQISNSCDKLSTCFAIMRSDNAKLLYKKHNFEQYFGIFLHSGMKSLHQISNIQTLQGRE